MEKPDKLPMEHVALPNVGPSSADSIGVGEFSHRQDFTQIAIPDGVRQIGDFAFCGCENLTHVALPDSLVEIGEAAFSACAKLTSISIPSGVKAIGRRAFADCLNLESASLPDSFADLRPDIFEGCVNLSEISAGRAYERLGNFLIGRESNEIAIASAGAVRDGVLRLPDGVSRIVPKALALCSQATKLIVPRSIEEIDGKALEGLHGINEVEIEDGSPFHIEDGNIMAGNVLTFHISDGSEGIAHVKVSGGLLRIGDHAFSHCTSLTEICFEADTECRIEIGESAFEGCKSLKLVRLPPQSTVSIGNSAFRCCSSLESAVVCEAESIGDMAFEGCEKLRNAPLTSKTENIGSDAFADCESLTEVEIPSGVRFIPEGAFANCSSLRKVDMHDDIESIGSQSFIGCAKLSEIDLPVGLKNIGEGAFAWSGLKSVAIPKGVGKIGGYAFGMCRGLEAATIPPQNSERTGDIFSCCPKLQIIGTNDVAK